MSIYADRFGEETEKLRPAVVRALHNTCMYCGESIPMYMLRSRFCSKLHRSEYMSAKRAFLRLKEKASKFNQP
jgi:hypothetical protein